MTIVSYEPVRNHVTRSHILLNQISPMVMSYKPILQHDNQNSDTDLVKT